MVCKDKNARSDKGKCNMHNTAYTRYARPASRVLLAFYRIPRDCNDLNPRQRYINSTRDNALWGYVNGGTWSLLDISRSTASHFAITKRRSLGGYDPVGPC